MEKSVAMKGRKNDVFVEGGGYILGNFFWVLENMNDRMVTEIQFCRNFNGKHKKKTIECGVIFVLMLNRLV